MRALNSVIGNFVLLLALTTAFSWAAEIDQRALSHEINKQIIPLDSAEIERQYGLYQQGMDDLDRYDDEQGEFNYREYAFDDDDSSEEQAPSTVDDAETQIQKNIYEYIVAFESENKLYGPEIKEIRKQYIKESKSNSNEFLPSDIAQLIGHFLDKKDEYDLAIEFYMLAANSCRSSGEEHLAAGAMLVRYFNSEVARSKPKAPTSELFAAVRKATWHYGCGSVACEIGDYFVDALKQVRDMMVRWPVSPKKLLEDNFYAPNYLVEKIYDINFVDTLLDDVKKLDKIFNSNTFVVNTKENNLLNALKNAGFKGVCKSLGSNYQYIWVNPKGYIIRIKYDDGKTGRKHNGEWQFTVGLSYINPFKWQGERVVGIKKTGDLDCTVNIKYVNYSLRYDDLLTYEYNEIFKIVIDKKLVMLAPAFRSFYWYLRGQELDEIMNKAHTKLFVVGKSDKIKEHCNLNRYGVPINEPSTRAPQDLKKFIVGGTPCKKQNLPKS